MEQQGLQFAAMLGSNGIHAKGMRGDCANTVKAVGSAVAGAVGSKFGGPIGAGIARTLFNEAWQTGKEIINGQPYTPPTLEQVKDGFGMNSPQFQIKDNILGQIQQNDRFEKLNDWFFNIFKPWAENYFDEDDIQELTPDEAKSKVNEIILNLEALRLMYQAQAVEKANALTGSQLGNGSQIRAQIDINGADPDGIVEFESLRSKSDAFAFLSDTIKDIFLKNMDNKNKNVLTKTIENFDPSRYDVNEPESIVYSSLATTSIDLFVFTANENISINYTDGETQRANDQVNKPETVFINNDKIQKSYGIIGLLIFVPWAYKKLFKSAKKNK